MLSRTVLFLLAGLLSAASLAADLIVEGSAPIRNGDIGQARELAARRALSRAAEFGSANISANSLLHNGTLTETTQLRTSACTENSEVIGETVGKDEVTQRLRVTVRESGTCHQMCRQTTRNRLVVAGFSVEHPEQILPGEKSWLTNLTSRELARWIETRGKVLVAHDGTAFPQASPDRAPLPLLSAPDTETPFSVLARRYRGQYVLTGVYRDIGLTERGLLKGGLINRFTGGKTRHIEIEAFIHDGVSGTLLDHKTFATIADGQVLMTPRPAVGSAEFYAGDLGRAWGGVLTEIADWAGEKVGCLPFMARVLKTEGRRIYLDAGSDAGLSTGDTLVLHSWRSPRLPVRGEGQMLLGEEKEARTTASIAYRYPEFSVAEMVEAGGAKPAPGDLFYAR